MIYEKLIFIILFFFLVDKIVYGQYIPGPRVGSQAILFNNRIYFIGGFNFNEGTVGRSDVFYYDNEAPLSAKGLLPWVDLENQVQLPLSIWHSASLGGTNQDSIFIIGGIQSSETSLVYQFDLKTNAIGPPTIQGTIPPRRRDMNAVNYEGKIYLFSGRISLNDTDNAFFNNFDILNTITMTWEVGGLVNAPGPRFLYTATLVNGVIYYIGGLTKNDLSNTGQVYELMSNIYQYDITSSTWSLKTATATVGLLPQERAAHTAVLVDGKICVYGGIIVDAVRVAPREVIAFLDTNSLKWSIPQFSNINTPKLDNINMPRVGFHTATLVNKLMFIAFGNITDVTVNNDYYIFDLEKLQWLKLTSDGSGNSNSASNPPNTPNTPIAPPNPLAPDSTTTSPSASTKPQDQQQPSNNTAIIIGLSVGLGIVGLGVIALFIFFYKRMKNRDAPEDYYDTGIPSENMTSRQIESAPVRTFPQQEINNLGSETPPPRPPAKDYYY